MALNAPAMALLGGLAEPAIRTLYGPQWDASAPLLSVLCLAGILWPMHVMNINLLYAFDRARQVFAIDVMKKGVGVVLIAVGAGFGLYGVALAQVGLGLIAIWVNGRATYQAVKFGPAQQVRCVAPVIGVALAVGVAVHVAADLWEAPSALELVVLGCAGAMTYLALTYLLGVRAVMDTLNMMRVKESQT
jgi:O-antigen/teichoic acid export membrane protein